MKQLCNIPKIAWEDWRSLCQKNQAPDLLSVLNCYDEKSKSVIKNFLKILSYEPDKFLICPQFPNELFLELKDAYSIVELMEREEILIRQVPPQAAWLVENFETKIEIQGLKNHYGLLSFIDDGFDILGYVSDKIIVDGGAYIGDSTFVYGATTPCKFVAAFEVDKNNIEKLKENTMTLESQGRVKIYKKALSSEKGKCFINESNEISLNTRFAETGEPVKCIDLDSLDLGEIGYIKLDIEGAEVPAIYGMQKTIEKYRPALSIAMYHNTQQMYTIAGNIGSWLRQFGYITQIRRLQYDSPVCEIYLQAFPKISNFCSFVV